jgi:predicted RNase H-like nuclease (RuvC/YqgF family)
VSDPADKTERAAKTSASKTGATKPSASKEGGRFAREGEAAVSGSDLLERLEAQAEKMTQARLRIRQLERALRGQVQKREAVEAELEEERAHGAELAAELARRYDEARSTETAGREVHELQVEVHELEQELASTRMQLEAVRAELTAKRPLSERMRPRFRR